MDISNLIRRIIDFAAAILVGRTIAFFVVLVLMYGYTVSTGVIKLSDLSSSYNLSQTAYIVSGKECYSVVDVNSNKIIYQRKVAGWPESEYRCYNGSEAENKKLSDEFALNSRGVKKSNFIIFYAPALILFILGVVVALGNTVVPTVGSKLSYPNILVIWVLICVALFPMTFSNYKSSAYVEVDSGKYYVTSINLSKDKTSYIELPINTFGKMVDATDIIEKRVSSI